MQTVTQRAGVAVLISDKIDFNIKIVTNNKGHFMMIKHQRLHYKHIYRSPKIHETKIDRTEGRKRQFNNNRWRLQQPPTFNNGYSN